MLLSNERGALFHEWQSLPNMVIKSFQMPIGNGHWESNFLNGYFSPIGIVVEIEVPSRVDGKRRNLARVSDFVSWDEACRVPRHKITHECKIPPLSIHE